MLVVSQASRDAAAPLFRTDWARAECLRGERDEDERVQLLERHAQAARIEALEEAASHVQRFETADWASYDPRTLATAIRALANPRKDTPND
jgi:hypothetical protein